jgi:TrmH family RNA methyltransferase
VLENIHIVLVATTHPGNIGASARAMKTMGLNSLRLVAPHLFPNREATARASGADDLLVNAGLYNSLAEAVSDCTTVIGTTARERTIAWPTVAPRACAAGIGAASRAGPVALVFGREHAGLTNDEIEVCNYLVRIPTAPAFSSLNLAAAVQILAYEIHLALRDEPVPVPVPVADAPATQVQMEQFYDHLQQTMTDVGFFDPAKPRRLLRRMRRLFNRQVLDATEVNILRGFLSAIQKQCRHEDDGVNL